MKTNNVDAMINTCVEHGKPFYYLLCLLDILNSISYLAIKISFLSKKISYILN